MITGLLLLPVIGILTWLYWYLLPGRSWRLIDWLMMILVLGLMTSWVLWVAGAEIEHAGPMFMEIVSVTGAYAILITGLATGLWWRRRQGGTHG
jgi:hypothetical protein